MNFFKKNIDSFVILLTIVTLLISTTIFYSDFRKAETLEDEIYILEQKISELSKLYTVELKTVRAKRGYQFTKVEWELNQYLQSKEETLAELEALKSLFQEEEYLRKLKSLGTIIHKRIAQFDRHIALIQQEEPEEAKLYILNEEKDMQQDSKKLNSIFQTLFIDLEEEITQKNQAIKKLESQIQWSFLVLVAMVISLLIVIVYRINKRIKREVEAKEKEFVHSITKENEEIFSSSFEYAPIGMALVSKGGSFIKVNSELCSILGYSSEELIQKSFQEITYHQDLREDLDLLDQLMQGAINSYKMEKRYFHKNGQIIWAVLGVSVVRNADHSVKFFVSQIEDISQRKLAKRKLLKEKERVSNILEGTNAATLEWNVQTGATIFNEKWANLIGYSLSELQPISIHTWTRLVHPDDLETSNQKLLESFSGKTPYYEAECRMKHKDGHWVWVLDRRKVISWTKEGKPLWMFGTHIDITEIKEANFALQKSQQKFKGIFNSTFQLMGLLDTDGTLREANETALEFGGLQIQDVVGKKVWDTFWWQISEEVQEELKEAVEKAAQGNTIKYEVAVWDKEKKPTSILFNLKPLLNPETNMAEAIIAEGRPIQEIVDARTALLNKNEELKSFATVAAHDLREPIRAISSFMKLLKAKYEKSIDAKGIQYIEHSIISAGRMNNLIVDLLEHAKIGTDDAHFEKIDMQKLIREIMALQKSVILEKNAKIISSELPYITGQKTAIGILFQNLISNALKYSSLNQPPVIEISARTNGNFQEFKIQDNGIGIDPQHHEKVFMMFRRLHARNEYGGTGMGLATCKKIIKHHGGDIWIESELGKGSTFYFTIPEK